MTTLSNPALQPSASVERAVTRTKAKVLQFCGLDLLRFAAAMIVMFYHLALVVAATPHPLLHQSYAALRPFAWPGWIGVEVFFTLSGFIISFSAQGASAASFAKGRFIRLYPTAWVCATITAIVLLATRTSPLGPNLIYRLFSTCLLFRQGPYLDYSYWTLEVELRFYLIVLLLLLAGKIHRIIPVISAFGLLSSASLVLTALDHSGHIHLPSAITAPISTPLGAVLNRIFLLDYGCFFAIGSLLWSCLLERASATRLILLAACCTGAIAGILLHAASLSIYLSTSFSATPALVYWIASIAIIIASVRFHDAISNALGTRGTRIARILGLVTYPLYLLHQEIGYRILIVLHSRIPDLAALALVMAGLILLAFLVHTWAERPLQHWFRDHLFSRRSRNTTLPATTLP